MSNLQRHYRRILNWSLTISLALVLVLIATSIAQAADSVGQSTDSSSSVSSFSTIDCSGSDPTASANDNSHHIAGKGIQESVHNVLASFFTRGSLHFRLQCDRLIRSEDGRLSVYSASLNLVNFGVLIILLIIAFANILRLKLDTYAVKKAIPLLIFGVVMANLGLPIIRTIVDFAGVLSANFISAASTDGTKTGFTHEIISAIYKGGATTIGNALGGLDTSGPVGWGSALAIVGITGFSLTALGPATVFYLVGFLFLIIFPAIMFLLLGLLFIARIYFLVILAAVSPVAFATLGFEPLRGKVWSWWWTHFLKWTFMAPATFALFWLGTRFFEAIGGQMDIGTYIITLFLIFYAIRIPLDLGSTVMKFWNERFVKPVGNALYSPFKAAGTYVKAGGPRDISRFLSSKNFNLVRTGKEIVGKIEESNVAKEAASPSVTGGQRIGTIIGGAEVSPLRAALRYNQLKAEQFKTPQGRERLLTAAEKFLTNAVGAERDDTKIQANDTLRQSLDVAQKKALASGDAELIAAARLANGLIGRADIGKELYNKALNDKGIKDTKPIDDLYAHLYQSRTGIPIISPSQANANPNIQNSQTAQLINRFGSALDNLQKEPEKQRKMYQSMIEWLRTISNDFKDLKNIERDVNGSAMARLLIKRIGDLPKDVSDEVRQKLIPNRNQLGSPDVNRLIPSSARPSFNPSQVQPFFEGDGLNEDIFRRIDNDQQKNRLRDLAQPAQLANLKTILKHIVTQALEVSEQKKLIEDSKKADFNNTILDTLINTNNSEAPKPVETSHLIGIGLSQEKAEQIVALMRPYNAALNSYQHLSNSGAAAAGPAQTTVNGSASPTSPPGPQPSTGSGPAPNQPAPDLTGTRIF